MRVNVVVLQLSFVLSGWGYPVTTLSGTHFIRPVELLIAISLRSTKEINVTAIRFEVIIAGEPQMSKKSGYLSCAKNRQVMRLPACLFLFCHKALTTLKQPTMAYKQLKIRQQYRLLMCLSKGLLLYSAFGLSASVMLQQSTTAQF